MVAPLGGLTHRRGFSRIRPPTPHPPTDPATSPQGSRDRVSHSSQLSHRGGSALTPQPPLQRTLATRDLLVRGPCTVHMRASRQSFDGKHTTRYGSMVTGQTEKQQHAHSGFLCTSALPRALSPTSHSMIPRVTSYFILHTVGIHRDDPRAAERPPLCHTGTSNCCTLHTSHSRYSPG